MCVCVCVCVLRAPCEVAGLEYHHAPSPRTLSSQGRVTTVWVHRDGCPMPRGSKTCRPLIQRAQTGDRSGPPKKERGQTKPHRIRETNSFLPPRVCGYPSTGECLLHSRDCELAAASLASGCFPATRGGLALVRLAFLGAGIVPSKAGIGQFSQASATLPSLALLPLPNHPLQASLFLVLPTQTPQQSNYKTNEENSKIMSDPMTSPRVPVWCWRP